MMLYLGDFLNRNLASCGSSGEDDGGHLISVSGMHDDVLAEWRLNNFNRYAKEKKLTSEEVEFMTSLAISALNLVKISR
jgi:hypothetical protein